MITPSEAKTDLGEKTFMFCVHCELTKWGESVAVAGAFCNWDPARALRMHTSEEIWPIWMSEPIKLHPASVEYKYIIARHVDDISAGSIPEFTWEQRENRQLHAGEMQSGAFAGLLNLALAITPRIGSAMPSKAQTCVVMDERFGHVALKRPVKDVLPTARRCQSPKKSWVEDADTGEGSGQSGSEDKGSQETGGESPSFSPRKEWCSSPAWQNYTPRSWKRSASTRCMPSELPRRSSLGAQETSASFSMASTPLSTMTSDSELSSDVDQSESDSNMQFDVQVPDISCDWYGQSPKKWQKWNRAAWDYPLSRKDKQDRVLNLFVKEEKAMKGQMIELTRSVNVLLLENQRLKESVYGSVSSRLVPERRRSVPPLHLNKLNRD